MALRTDCGRRRPVEAFTLEFAEDAEGGGIGSADGGSVAVEERSRGLGVVGTEKSESLTRGGGDFRIFVVHIGLLANHFEFKERRFHGSDSFFAPGGRDHFVHEIQFDAVDGLEAQDVVVHEPVELARILIGEEDEVAGAEIVTSGVVRRFGFSFGRDGALGHCAVVSGCFVLLVGSHTFYRSDGSIGAEIWRGYGAGLRTISLVLCER